MPVSAEGRDAALLRAEAILAEQQVVDKAYRCLDTMRDSARAIFAPVIGTGVGTPQALTERDIAVRTGLRRLADLDIGDTALCFGRIDYQVQTVLEEKASPGKSAPAISGTPAISGVEPAGENSQAGGGLAENGQAGGGLAENGQLHIGRIAVWDENQDPVVVDWRAPVAEPFYRATPNDPMGLVMRRHLEIEGRRVTDLQDEHLAPEPARAGTGSAPGQGSGDATGRGGLEDGPATGQVHECGFDPDTPPEDLDALLEPEIVGREALLGALRRSRSGWLGDIVATVQRSQDAIIRAPLPGVLVVQGGPGTGKTAVALHRAAYLLYTHRFPLERQGMLVLGPNPIFMRYIERVLPSLGENGVTLSTVAGCYGLSRPRATEPPALAALKGDIRMARVIERAIRDRERRLIRPVNVKVGSVQVTLTPEMSERIVRAARKRQGTHNERRRLVERAVLRELISRYEQRFGQIILAQQERRIAAIAGSPLDAPAESNESEEHNDRTSYEGISVGEVPYGRLDADLRTIADDGQASAREAAAGSRERYAREQMSRDLALRRALDRMWPRLSAEELLRDLFGAPALLASAGNGILTEEEQSLLYRPRSPSTDEVPWTAADMALLDEARALLGDRASKRGSRRKPAGSEEETGQGARGRAREDWPRRYGHIIVDEAQDCSPMDLRMIGRRSLNGSATLVGDLAQAAGTKAYGTWNEIIGFMAPGKPWRMEELDVNYRTPELVMSFATPVLRAAFPELSPPRSVRRGTKPPEVIDVTSGGMESATVLEEASPDGSPHDLLAVVAEQATRISGQQGGAAGGVAAVIVPPSLLEPVAGAIEASGTRAWVAGSTGATGTGPLGSDGQSLLVCPADLAKGLEFDLVIVVEPAAIAEELPGGERALYVALTRTTGALLVIHASALPASLAGSAVPSAL